MRFKNHVLILVLFSLIFVSGCAQVLTESESDQVVSKIKAESNVGLVVRITKINDEPKIFIDEIDESAIGSDGKINVLVVGPKNAGVTVLVDKDEPYFTQLDVQTNEDGYSLGVLQLPPGKTHLDVSATLYLTEDEEPVSYVRSLALAEPTPGVLVKEDEFPKDSQVCCYFCSPPGYNQQNSCEGVGGVVAVGVPPCSQEASEEFCKENEPTVSTAGGVSVSQSNSLVFFEVKNYVDGNSDPAKKDTVQIFTIVDNKKYAVDLEETGSDTGIFVYGPLFVKSGKACRELASASSTNPQSSGNIPLALTVNSLTLDTEFNGESGSHLLKHQENGVTKTFQLSSFKNTGETGLTVSNSLVGGKAGNSISIPTGSTRAFSAEVRAENDCFKSVQTSFTASALSLGSNKNFGTMSLTSDTGLDGVKVTFKTDDGQIAGSSTVNLVANSKKDVSFKGDIVSVGAACGNNVKEGSEACDGSGQAQCSSGQTCQSCQCVTESTNIFTVSNVYAEALELGKPVTSGADLTPLTAQHLIFTLTHSDSLNNYLSKGGTVSLLVNGNTVLTWTGSNIGTHSAYVDQSGESKISADAPLTNGANTIILKAGSSTLVSYTGVLAGCLESWSCTSWSPSACDTGVTQTRTCTDSNSCGTTSSKPSESQSCGSPPYHQKDAYLTEINKGVAKTFSGIAVGEVDSAAFSLGANQQIIYVVAMDSSQAVYKTTISATVAIPLIHQQRYGPPQLSYSNPGNGETQFTSGPAMWSGDQQRVVVTIGPASQPVTGSILVAQLPGGGEEGGGSA